MRLGCGRGGVHATGVGSVWRRAAGPRRCCPSPAPSGGRSRPPITSTMRFAIDRPRPKPSPLGHARASIEAVEDPILLVGRDSLPGVLYLDRHAVLGPTRGAKGNRARRGRVRASVAEQTEHHLAEQHGIPLGDQIGLDLVHEAPRPRGARPRRSPQPAATVTSTTCAGSRSPASDPRQHEQRLGEPRHPLGVVRQPGQEAVAGIGVVLGAGLQHLDPAHDPGERVAQLMRRVGDELAPRPARA